MRQFEKNKLINQIKDIYNNVDCSFNFHKKASHLLKLMETRKFLSETFEKNLTEKSFIKKKWKSYEIPKLTIYEDEDFSLYYHIFCPIKNSNSEIASYLIHDHQNYILSSYIFFGNGYKTIEFAKKANDNFEKYKLTIIKNFHHSNKNINILDSHTPHVIFNVPETTSSIVLWSKDQRSAEKVESRISYFIENKKIKKINEEEFINKTEKIKNFENDSEKHIEAICFLLQKNKYENDRFLNEIIGKESTNDKWKKCLKKLVAKKPIFEPIFKHNTNTFNMDIRKKDIENLCNFQ